MEIIRYGLQLTKPVTGRQIIDAMKKICGIQTVLFSHSGLRTQGELLYVLGCRGKYSQSGDAMITVEGQTVVDPGKTYKQIEVFNHPWIEKIGNPWKEEYLKVPRRGDIQRFLEKLKEKLEEEFSK